MINEPLKKAERTKLFIFAILNLLCGVVTGFAAIYIWIQKIALNPEEQSNVVIFALLASISGTSVFGVVAVR